VKTGRGKDEITGGTGADAIKARGGRDLIDALDGERDRVDCGKGRDRVRADAIDELVNCEIRLRPRD
jgi:hypothetical protein